MQMLVSLEVFFRKLLIERAEIDLVSIENLSDTLIQQSSITSLLQIKRTLNATTLADTIREAYEIAILADQCLDERIRFQIACELKETELSIYQLDASRIFRKGESFDVKQLSRTRALFDPNAPIVVIADPVLALYRTFWLAGVPDPASLATRCLGTLFKAFDGHHRENVEHALYDLIEVVKGATRNHHHNAGLGRILTATNFQIAQQPSLAREPLIGRRPRVADFVADRFKNRSGLLAGVERAANDWLSSLPIAPDDDDGILHIFWIEGRAGDGKSVLLLQLVSRLLSGKLSFITELANRKEIESWLRDVPVWDDVAKARGAFPSVAFIDDLHEKIEKDELESLVSEVFYRGTRTAAILTCGPSLDLSSFSESISRFRIKSFKVPSLSISDREEFTAWYESRTGQLAKPVGESRSWLLVEWLLQISRGNLEHEFADNFRRSLERQGLLEIATTVAAVNTLSVGAPETLLTTVNERIGFDAVSSQGAQHFELRKDEDEVGLFLTHPALTWPLFRAWTKKDGVGLAAVWGARIGVALSHFLNADQPGAARFVLGQLLDAGTFRARFQCKTFSEQIRLARTTLESAYETLEQRHALAAQAPVMALWLAAQKLQRLKAHSAVGLRALAATLLRSERHETRFRSEIAVALLSLNIVEDDAEKQAQTWLIENSECSQHVIGSLESLARKDEARLKFHFFMGWLRTRTTDARAFRVFVAAIERYPQTEAHAISLEFVRNNSGAEAGCVLLALARSGMDRQALGPAATLWINTTSDKRIVPKLLCLLLRQGVARLYRRSALRWLAANPGVPWVEEVIKLLLAHDPQEKLLVDAVELWLSLHKETMQAAQILRVLVKNRACRSRWLAAAKDHVLATQGPIRIPVLASLLSSIPSTEDVLLALDLIEADPTSSESRFLFSQLAIGVKKLSNEKIQRLRRQCRPECDQRLRRAIEWSPKGGASKRRSRQASPRN